MQIIAANTDIYLTDLAVAIIVLTNAEIKVKDKHWKLRFIFIKVDLQIELIRHITLFVKIV